MRFATYSVNGGPARAGVVADHGIHPLPADVTVLGLVRAGLPAAIEAGVHALDQPGVPLDAVRLLPPLGDAAGGRSRRRWCLATWSN